MYSLSHVQLFATPWTVAYQAPPSMAFSRQEHWSGLPFHFPGDLPNPGIEPGSPASQADTLPSVPPGGSDNEILVKSLSRVRLFATPWTVAYSMLKKPGEGVRGMVPYATRWMSLEDIMLSQNGQAQKDKCA